MNCKKVNGSFNEYKLELSFGELEAIYRAMETDHADPIADEVFNGLKWYIDQGNVPLPGEDDKKGKDKEKGGDDADAMLPDPDGYVQGMDEPGPRPPQDMPDEEPEGPISLSGDSDDDGAGDDDADSKLEEPPDA